MSDPKFYQDKANDISSVKERFDKLELIIDEKLQRWEELEQLKIKFEGKL